MFPELNLKQKKQLYENYFQFFVKIHQKVKFYFDNSFTFA